MEKKNLVDLLDFGTHTLKVRPQREWDKENRVWIEGTHKSGTGKAGKWWMYATNIEGEWITVFANAKNTHLFDSGEVAVDIVKRFDPQTGEQIKKYFFNDKSGRQAPNKEAINDEVDKDIERLRSKSTYEPPISIEQVPF